MAYDARLIANWFVKRVAQDSQTLSIMTLLKLTYIAHGWHLETTGKPLFDNRIEAWQHGPVIPDLYSAFRSQGISVTKETAFFEADLSKEVQSLLEQVYQIYGKASAFQLSNLTHVPGGPWDIAIKTGGRNAIIPDDLILQHYRAKRDVATQQANA